MAKNWWSRDPRTVRDLVAQAAVLAAFMLAVTLLLGDSSRDVLLRAGLFPLLWTLVGLARLWNPREQ